MYLKIKNAVPAKAICLHFHNSLNIKRWKCGLVALGNSLFAIGGMDSPKAGHWGNPLKTVERYDPNLDKWTEVASMNEARFGSAVVTYQVYIFTFMYSILSQKVV